MSASGGMGDLVIDVGGTNARLALARRGDDGRLVLDRLLSERVARYDTAEAAIKHYLSEIGDGLPDRIGIGAAGPVRNGYCKLTNAHWSLDAAALAPMTESGTVVLANDMKVAARVVPDLRPEMADLETLKGTHDLHTVEGARDASAVVVNIGTGFGVAPVHRVAIGDGGRWFAFGTEGGNISNPSQAPGITTAHSIEDIIAGRGLAAYANAMAGRDAFASAEAVLASGDDAADTTAEVVRTMSWIIGRATRDCILSHCAWDGVY
ncbi:MAG: glucokinase, partial [Pseudomonadota bacterium]